MKSHIMIQRGLFTWFTSCELDFVIIVYAALMSGDGNAKEVASCPLL